MAQTDLANDHLEKAMRTENVVEKKYHIRSALQHLSGDPEPRDPV